MRRSQGTERLGGRNVDARVVNDEPPAVEGSSKLEWRDVLAATTHQRGLAIHKEGAIAAELGG